MATFRFRPRIECSICRRSREATVTPQRRGVAARNWIKWANLTLLRELQWQSAWPLTPECGNQPEVWTTNGRDRRLTWWVQSLTATRLSRGPSCTEKCHSLNRKIFCIFCCNFCNRCKNTKWRLETFAGRQFSSLFELEVCFFFNFFSSFLLNRTCNAGIFLILYV